MLKALSIRREVERRFINLFFHSLIKKKTKMADYQEYVGVNYLGKEGSDVTRTISSGWWRFFFEPFITYENAYSPPDAETGKRSLKLGAMKLTRTYIAEFTFSFLMSMLALGAGAGAWFGGLNYSLAGVIGYGVHAVARSAFTNSRFSGHLPRDLGPTFTLTRLLNGKLGLVWALGYWLMQTLAAVSAFGVLRLTGLVWEDTWKTMGPATKIGVSPQLTDFVAIVWFTFQLMVPAMLSLYNQQIRMHRFGDAGRHNHVNRIVSGSIFVMGMFGIHLGFVTGNGVLSLTSIFAGLQVTRFHMGAYLILSVIIAGGLAWILAWLMWNMDALTKESIDHEKSEERMHSSLSGEGVSEGFGSHGSAVKSHKAVNVQPTVNSSFNFDALLKHE